MDMEFKRVREEREWGVESIELVDWGVIGKVEETEVDTGQDADQNDVEFIEEGRPGRGRESTQRREEHGRCKRGLSITDVRKHVI